MKTKITPGVLAVSNIVPDAPGRVVSVDATSVVVTWDPGDDREATRPMAREDFVWMTRPIAGIEMITDTGSRAPHPEMEWED